MVSIKVKEDKVVIDYDYLVSSLAELEELMKVIYKPIFGLYKVGLSLHELRDIKFLLNNKEKYSHLDIYLTLTEKMYKDLSLAMPHAIKEDRGSIFDYLMDGISKRNLLIQKSAVYTLYNSISKSYEEIDDTLDLLEKKFGPFMSISEKDLSKYVILNKITYPRTVLIDYINLNPYRKQKLQKCLTDISPDIVLAAMIKNVKKLHEQKSKYLVKGLGNKFIRDLNTRNLNMMYYVLCCMKPYYLNDITVLLEIYERGISYNDLFF